MGATVDAILISIVNYNVSDSFGINMRLGNPVVKVDHETYDCRVAGGHMDPY